MDNGVATDLHDWRHTKEAVAKFRRLLICSKCSNLMKEPVCLGMCDHMLCRPCAGPRAGDGCGVCHSPAWVKDIQINRQLSSVVQLFCGLESLLGPNEQQDSSVVEKHPQSESPILKHKKNFKIWFSPRSRKVRCMEEKPSEVTALLSRSSEEAVNTQPDTATTQGEDLSIYNFTSSSEDLDSCGSERCEQKKMNRKKGSTKKKSTSKTVSVKGALRTTRKQTQQKKKTSRLEAINQQWGVAEEVEAHTKRESTAAGEARRSSKRVSFLSPPDSSETHPTTVPPLNTIGESLQGRRVTVPDKQIQLCQGTLNNDKLPLNDPNVGSIPETPNSTSPPSCPQKDTNTTPKRPPASPRQRKKTRMSPAILNPSSSPSPKSVNKSPKPERGEAPSGVGRRSPCSPAGRPTSGSPAVMKRNLKGESLLHLAAIKGDVDAVRELLDQGSDPNLKDNAGWTPLHEACNLGHLAVVELLLSKGALLNTPGYENDSPLHDAVRNGHPAIVRLLLQQGALQNVLNLNGKRPADYAVSLEMLQIFQDASKGTQYANPALSPSASLPMVTDCSRREEMLVFYASKLSQTEQLQLGKLGELLGGRMADTFSDSVSHVVVPQGNMPTTSSTLLGLLAGCWIVKFSWVEACLQASEWIPETDHEAGEGPQRSRINRCSLLPPLFDGCFFFLLGSLKAPPKHKLIELLREGGAQLLSRQPKPDSDVTQTLSAAAYHAEPGSDQTLCTQYIIFDPRGPHKPAVVRRGKVWSAPSTWVIECITAFRLLPVPDPQTDV